MDGMGYVVRFADALLNDDYAGGRDDTLYYESAPYYNPRHVPTLLGPVSYWPECICLEPANHMWWAPWVTWYNTAYGDQWSWVLPADHGQIDSEYAPYVRCMSDDP